MGQARPKNRAVLIVEDDAELRHLTAALFEDEQMDTIECESAEAALAERIRELPPGVAYMPKPWKPLNVLIAAEQALASGRGN
jgi:FixJ family two-component response regulator